MTIPAGATLDLSHARRTLTAAQLLSRNWRRGNPPYTDGAAFPWGNPPLDAPGMQWLAGLLTTAASYQPDAPQTDYPAFSGEPNEAAVYPNGDAVAELGADPFLVDANGRLVIQPRLLTLAEAAALAATPAPWLQGRKWLSGAAVTAPFCQAGGYFEVVAKLPKLGPGIWPAFWLMPVSGAWPPEIDILEAGPFGMTTSVHPGPTIQDADTEVIQVAFDPSASSHRYGVWVAADFITTFWDRRAVRSVPTPAALAGVPLYLLIDYALGGAGSWPGPLPDGTTTVPPLTISDVGAWSGTIGIVTLAPGAAATIAAAQKELAAARAAINQAMAILAALAPPARAG